MQILGVPPGAAVAVFAEVFDDEPHVLQVADAGLGMSEPKTLRVIAHEGHGPLAQIRRGRSRRRRLAQFLGFGSHTGKLMTTRARSKEPLVPHLPECEVTAENTMRAKTDNDELRMTRSPISAFCPLTPIQRFSGLTL